VKKAENETTERPARKGRASLAAKNGDTLKKLRVMVL